MESSPGVGGLSPQVGIDDWILGAPAPASDPTPSTSKRARRISSSRRRSSTSKSSSIPEARTRTRRNTGSTDDPEVPAVTKFGRKVKKTDRFTHTPAPEPEKEESDKLKYYKRAIKAIFRETGLKMMFDEFFDRVYVEGYREVIREPMWLEKIKNKLERGEYYTAEELESDFQLIIDNCYTFNPEGNPENVEIRETCSRLEKWWKNCKENYETLNSTLHKHFRFASLLSEDDEEEEEEDDTPWTSEEIDELLVKVDSLPPGKLGNVLGIIRRSEPVNLDQNKQMIVDYGQFKASTLNALEKEVTKRLIEVKKQEEKKAKTSAKSEKVQESKRVKRKAPAEVPAKDVRKESEVAETEVSETRQLSDSEVSERESSSSESSTASSSSEAETQSESEVDEETEKPKSKARKNKSKPLLASAEPNLSESEASDPEETTSNRAQNGLHKRKSENIEAAPEGDQYTATPPFKKIKESAPRRLDFSSPVLLKTQSAESFQPDTTEKQEKVLWFGILKIPVDTPSKQIDKLFGTEPEKEETLPEISSDRKAMRDEAARKRKAAATFPDPNPSSEDLGAFSPAAADQEEYDPGYLFDPNLDVEESDMDGNYQMDIVYHQENEEEEGTTASSDQDSLPSPTVEHEPMSSKSEIPINEDSSVVVSPETGNYAEIVPKDDSENSDEEIDLDALDYSEC